MNRFCQILLITLLYSLNGLSFDSEKCAEALKPIPGIGGLVSTTQFSTSFGGCSAIGSREVAQQFVAQNELTLKSEISNGSGDYLVALRESLSCSGGKQSEFNLSLQKQMPQLLHLSQDIFFDKIVNTTLPICSSKNRLL